MKHYKKIKKCRVCDSENLAPVVKLDEQYVGTTFVKDNKTHPMADVKIPLTLLLCEKCKLVQLEETVNPDLLYTNYFYRTSVNDTMRRDLHDVVECACSQVELNDGDYVIDIGANDMTMLSMFPENLNRVGVEPAKNIDWSGTSEKITIVNDYFTDEALQAQLGNQKAKVITSCACFYDMPDPNKITQDIKKRLDPDGVCVIQVSSLLATVKDFNFYDICHEHLEYYSLKSINYLMESNGLSIYDVSTNFVNGGSFRIYVTHQENRRVKTKEFYQFLAEEMTYGLEDLNTYSQFQERINVMSEKARNFIVKEIETGGLVLGLGASTKSSVLLQICKIGKDILPAISDRSPIKVGLKMLGLDIPLVSEEAAREMEPTVMLVLPWNFKNEIIRREQEYLLNGGKLLFIMPHPYLLDTFGETRL